MKTELEVGGVHATRINGEWRTRVTLKNGKKYEGGTMEDTMEKARKGEAT